MRKRLNDLYWRTLTRAMSMPPPKFIERMEAYNPGPVKMPTLWQVMIAPVVILLVVGILCTL